MGLRSLVVCFSLLLLLQSCKTTKQNDAVKILDGEATEFEPGPDASAEKTVPAFLWSPSRRRATAGYYYLVAEYMAMERKFKNARPMFEFAYGLDPNPFLGAKLVAAEAGVGDVDKALPEAKKLVLLYPKSPHLRFLYGQLLAQKGLFKESVAEIEKAIADEPQREEYYLELAGLYQAAKETPKAIKVLTDYLQKSTTSIAAMVRLAKLYLATNKKKEALAIAQRAYEIDGSNAEVVLVYALSLEINGQSSKALALYEQLYRMDPTNEELIGRMIELYRSIGDLNQSVELLNELAELPGGNRPGIQLQRAILLWELKKFADAAAILEELTKENPQQDRLRYMAGLGQEKLKNYELALEHFAAIGESSQFYQQAKLRRALIFKEQHKYEESLKLLKSLRGIKDSAEEVYALIAEVYGDMEKYDDAVDTLEEGYKKFPDKPRLLFLKGVFQEKDKDIDGCVKTMRAVIIADPANSSAYNYLGYLFAERNENLDEAEKLISKALKLKPNDGYYLDSLAWVYYQKKDYKTALKYLDQAHKQVPDEGVIFEHYGDVHKAMGAKKTALDYYEKAAKTNLEKRDEARILDKLKKMRAEMKEATKH